MLTYLRKSKHRVLIKFFDILEKERSGEMLIPFMTLFVLVVNFFSFVKFIKNRDVEGLSILLIIPIILLFFCSFYPARKIGKKFPIYWKTILKGKDNSEWQSAMFYKWYHYLIAIPPSDRKVLAES